MNKYKEGQEEAKAKKEALISEYKNIATNPAFLDLVSYMTKRSEMNCKLAKDGYGYNNDGHSIVMNRNERLSCLDRAAGFDEVLAYIERMSQDIVNPK